MLTSFESITEECRRMKQGIAPLQACTIAFRLQNITFYKINF